MLLYYPTTFTSTQTYQNANFKFPHDTALSSTYDQLKTHFYSPDYILPAYLSYGHYDIVLEETELLSLLGVSFIKLKSLEEKLDFLFEEAFEWKKTHMHGKYQNEINQYITEEYANQMMIDVSNITTVVQLMIITYIDLKAKGENLLLDPEVILLLKEFIAIKMIILPVSIVIYLVRVIPIILKLANQNYIIV